MTNIRKVGLLLAMLVLPAFIFFFLKSQGKNHFTKLPRFYPVYDENTEQPVLHTAILGGKTIQDTVFRKLPDFQLTDEEGKPFTRNRLKGKIHVADFIFTRCPGQCPLMSKEMQRVQEQLSGFEEIVLVSYTVDPAFDTPAVLKEYGSHYHAISGKWFFVTGAKKDIYGLALDFYKANNKEMDTKSTDLQDIFVHTEKFVLVDSEGIIRGYYNGKDKFEIDKLILEAKVLDSELKSDIER